MTRWKVRRERGMFWDEDDELCTGPRWHVTSPMGVSWGNFATHDEAMSRVDRESRTITVTLPRDPHLKRYRLDVRRHPYGEVIELRRRKTDNIRTAIPRDSWEPLALALLAHARKEKA